MNDAELDIEDRTATERYLVAAGHCAAGELTQHEVLAGGVSGRTVRVTFADGRAWVLKQALAKLRVQADWFSDPRRIHREAQGMRALAELAPPGAITKLLFDDERHHVIGMEAVPQPHENWKTMLLAGDNNMKYVKQFGKLLGTIHRESSNRRHELEWQFKDRKFFETLRIEPYYEYSAKQDSRASDFLNELLAETRKRSDALVHGDFSPKNVLVHSQHLVLLDHEVIHWGDPAFDVGFAVSHLIGKGHYRMPEYFYETPSDLSRDRSYTGSYQMVWDFWKYYRAEIYNVTWLEGFENRCVRHALACTLARAIGRSPFEYLNETKRHGQQETVVRMFHRDFRGLTDMTMDFFLDLDIQTREVEER